MLKQWQDESFGHPISKYIPFYSQRRSLCSHGDFFQATKMVNPFANHSHCKLKKHSLYSILQSGLLHRAQEKQWRMTVFKRKISKRKILKTDIYLVWYLRLNPFCTVPSGLTRSVVFELTSPPMRYVPTPLCGVQDWVICLIFGRVMDRFQVPESGSHLEQFWKLDEYLPPHSRESSCVW